MRARIDRAGREQYSAGVTMIKSSIKVSPMLILLAAALVVTIDFSPSMGFGAENGFRKVRTEETDIYYEGSVIVSGIYRVQTIDDGIGSEYGLVCFSVHGPTEHLIPREGDNRTPWFCFSNTARALSALRIPDRVPWGTCIIHGKATVKISNYHVVKSASEVHDEAILVRVISYEKPRFRRECMETLGSSR